MNGRFAAVLIGAVLGSSGGAQQAPPSGRGGMAVKAVVCRTVDAGRGKAGQELADAIEAMAAMFDHQNYQLAALLPGDPPIACFTSRADSSKLPKGAR